ncbi:hypothetical protein ACQY0O_001224 [Thecaphora frezii]
MAQPPRAPTTPWELAKVYNELPRQQKTPSGLMENFWTASVRKVTLEPPGLVMQLVNPGSRYIHVEKLPVPVEDEDKPERLAVPVALAIMKAFAEGLMSPDTPGVPQDRPTRFAPWQLGMPEQFQNLAKLVERQLKGLGVEKPRRNFRITTKEEAEIADKVWDDFFVTLRDMVVKV